MTPNCPAFTPIRCTPSGALDTGARVDATGALRTLLTPTLPGAGMPDLARHQRWKEASRRADDAANAIDEMLQACLDVPVSMRAELERLEADAAEKFGELTNWPAPGLQPLTKPLL
jgi:hypothetical protein